MSQDTIEYSYQYAKKRIEFEPFRPMDELEGYDPNALIDSLKARYGYKTDSELSRFLDVSPPTISKVRNLSVAVSADLLLRMHDKTGLSIAELRKRLGVA